MHRWHFQRLFRWLVPTLVFIVLLCLLVSKQKAAGGGLTFLDDAAYGNMSVARTLVEDAEYGLSAGHRMPAVRDTLWNLLLALVALIFRDAAPAAYFLGAVLALSTMLISLRLARLLFPFPPFVVYTAVLLILSPGFLVSGVSGTSAALAETLDTTAEKLVPEAVARWYGGSEDAFRAAVCEQAKKYMGTEYRWGGKSGRGIDCSGLVSSAYMQCGVLIYRDAKIIEGWPMHEVAFENKKPGDALFFPGHVALYLGEGRYIHSTGAAASGGVVINSLEPDDPLYREDLVKCLYAVGSVF